MVGSTITVPIISLLVPCCLLLAIGTPALDKIHPLAHPSDPSSVSQDLSVKFTLEKSNFMYIKYF